MNKYEINFFYCNNYKENINDIFIRVIKKSIKKDYNMICRNNKKDISVSTKVEVKGEF